jgi:hypothetical protein
MRLTQTVVLLLFVSGLAFSSGAFIGKRVSDSEHRRAQLEGEYQNIATHDTEDVTHPAEKKSDEKLSDDDIASLTEEFVTKERAAEVTPTEEEPAREIAATPETNTGYKKFAGGKETAKNEMAEAPANMEPTAKPMAMGPAIKTPGMPMDANHMGMAENHPTMPMDANHMAMAPAAKMKPPAKAPAKAVSEAATRIASGEAPAPDMAEARKPSAVLPSVAATAVGKYTVQVASYPDETQAKNHAATLKAKGWNAFYVPADIQGKPYYRVSVGLFTSAKSAGEFRKEFQKESQVANAIVQKIIK